MLGCLCLCVYLEQVDSIMYIHWENIVTFAYIYLTLLTFGYRRLQLFQANPYS